MQRLRDAGALIVGKTNLDQFASGLVGVRSPYGVPRNVFNAAYVPGGSSSGSAIAVAAGIVDFVLGTDTAGSDRVPAAFGNIVGLKPTIGSVPATGMVPACRSIDTISIFARTVDAALAVQRVITGYDAADPYARLPPAGFLRRGGLSGGLRIAVADVAALCTDDVAQGYRRAADLFETATVDIAPLLAIAVPAGFGADGLPVGVTVHGPAWAEGRLAALADQGHRACVAGLPSPAAPDALAADETGLFCIGAHMAGLPLDGQVTALGGRFLRSACTAPEYRLHALGPRPGMARGTPGAAIAGEVWALPTAAIGALLAQVPPPLGFGTVALEDGPCLGFLAEGQALGGTRDITDLGSWRAWLAVKETST